MGYKDSMDGGDTAEKIWYDDPRGLFSGDRFTRFVPESEMSLAGKLNAIMRFSVYLGVLIALYRWEIAPTPVAVVLGSAVVTWGVYVSETQRIEEINKENLVSGSVDPITGTKSPVETDPYTRKKCSSPTKDNPYMNVMMGDFATNPDRFEACDVVNRSDVRERVKDLADSNLYVDSDDIYDRAGSRRMFVTNPSTTIPNDQDGFAKWLYSDSSLLSN
jgi:hypothetical protein